MGDLNLNVNILIRKNCKKVDSKREKCKKLLENVF